jgi:hypothetical protein
VLQEIKFAQLLQQNIKLASQKIQIAKNGSMMSTETYHLMINSPQHFTNAIKLADLIKLLLEITSIFIHVRLDAVELILTLQKLLYKELLQQLLFMIIWIASQLLAQMFNVELMTKFAPMLQKNTKHAFLDILLANNGMLMNIKT